jgi:hypothetical protein
MYVKVLLLICYILVLNMFMQERFSTKFSKEFDYFFKLDTNKRIKTMP